MGFGSYNYSALTEIRQIAARLLEGFSTAQFIETGCNVIRVLEDFKKQHPDKIPTKQFGGLLDMGPFPINDFELALHLVGSNNPAMTEAVMRAERLPALIAYLETYLEILGNNTKLPDESWLESASSFAIGALKIEGDVAKLWNQYLQKDVEELRPLAKTAQKYSATQATRRSGKTKLTESQERQVVREDKAAPFKYGLLKALASKFDVTDETIAAIVRDVKRE